MKKFNFALIVLLFLASCQGNKEQESQQEPPEELASFFLGTYSGEGAEGIYTYKLYEDGSLAKAWVAAATKSPSYLTITHDKKFLLTINELETGTIESYRIVGDSLDFVNGSLSGGAHPCFITTNKDGYVLTANYTGGNVGLLQVDENGALSAPLDIQQHEGSSVHTRQKAPHAHSVWFAPSGDEVIAVDLGTDELWFSTLDKSTGELQPNEPHTLKMEPGAGPRHLAIHPNGKWIYVINELNSTISMVSKNDSGQYEINNNYSTLPGKYEDTNYGADIHISSDGKFLYASNRGHNSIAIFSIDNSNGTLSVIDHTHTEGRWPRNFAFSPDESFIVVANQHTNNLSAFIRDKATGLLTFTGKTEAPTPVCIVFN